MLINRFQICTVALLASCLLMTTASGCSNKSEGGADLAELFPGDAPSFPPPASKLKIGVSEADAKGLIPEIFAAKHGELSLPAYGKKVDVSALFTSMGSEGTWLRYVTVQVPSKAGLAAIEAKWGAPSTVEVKVLDEVETHHFWFNASASLRAVASPHAGYADMIRVQIGEYLDPVTFVGSEGNALGFEKTAIIGSDVAALQSAYGERLTTREAESLSGGNRLVGHLVLPPIGHGQSEVLATIDFEGKVATGYELVLPAADAQTRASLPKLFEKRFGPAKPAAEVPDLAVYPADFGVALGERGGNLVIVIGAKGRLETE